GIKVESSQLSPGQEKEGEVESGYSSQDQEKQEYSRGKKGKNKERWHGTRSATVADNQTGKRIANIVADQFISSIEEYGPSKHLERALFKDREWEKAVGINN
ncbi:hypothetical protein BGZ83_003971, partial [Gryganskiella cystojenkinii]